MVNFCFKKAQNILLKYLTILNSIFTLKQTSLSMSKLPKISQNKINYFLLESSELKIFPHFRMAKKIQALENFTFSFFSKHASIKLIFST